jgi:hypothetical protein
MTYLCWRKLFVKSALCGVHDAELRWLDACKDFVEADDTECGFPSWNWKVADLTQALTLRWAWWHSEILALKVSFPSVTEVCMSAVISVLVLERLFWGKWLINILAYIWFLLYFGIIIFLPHFVRGGKWPHAGGNCIIISFEMCMPCQILWSSEGVSWVVRVVQMVAKRNVRDIKPKGKVTLWWSVLDVMIVMKYIKESEDGGCRLDSSGLE